MRKYKTKRGLIILINLLTYSVCSIAEVLIALKEKCNVVCSSVKCEKHPAVLNAASAFSLISGDFANVLNIDLYPGRYIFVEISFKKED